MPPLPEMLGLRAAPPRAAPHRSSGPGVGNATSTHPSRLQDREVPGVSKLVRLVRLLLIFPLVLAFVPSATAQDGDRSSPGAGNSSPSESVGTVFHVGPRANPTATPEDASDLATPQGTVEAFLFACRTGRWEAAARTFDLRLLPGATRTDAATLARKFYEVLGQELWIDWSLLPDRPDGLDAGSFIGGDAPMAGEPRRSISLGTVELRDRPVPIRISRLLPEGGEPLWLFSAQTVENIEGLYAQHGPSVLAGRLPDWARQEGWARVPIWQWMALALIAVLAPVAALLVARVALPRIARILPGRAKTLADNLEWPVATAVALGIAWAALDWLLALPARVGEVVGGLVSVAFIVAVGWTLIRAVAFAIEHVAKQVLRNRTDEDSSSRRRLLTQLTVARHLIGLVLVVVTIGVILLEFNLFRTIGVMLLTSAGVAAVVFGIAGHAVLGNLVAGLQIALTRPFRVGDTVNVEDNWGSIEDVTYTYVIVRTWDKRRLVLPIQYFVQHHFENWARNDRFLQKPIYLQVDFRADVDRIREKFLALIEDDENWDADQDEPTVLVTTSDDETMTVRLTAGGSNPSQAWALECRIREQLLAWVREVEDGAWLPRRRATLERSRSRNDRNDDDEDTAATPPRGSRGSDEALEGRAMDAAATR